MLLLYPSSFLPLLSSLVCVQLGTYNPIPYELDTTKEVRLRLDRIKYWLSVGAQPSDRVNFLLWRAGILPAPPIHYTPQRWVPKKVLREESKKKFHTLSDAGTPRLAGGSSGTGAFAPTAALFSGLFLRPRPTFLR